MITRSPALVAVLAATAVCLSACDGGDKPKAAPSSHPVFSQPLGRQVLLAVRRTQKAGSAGFTQRVTFSSRKGAAVQTLTGRLDFASGRGEATSTWRVPSGFPAETREAVLGATQGRGTADASGRYVVDNQTIHYRAASSAYWLSYGAADAKPLWGIDSISHLRGTEAPVGGTLLEALSGAEATSRQGTAGRTYRADFSRTVAMHLFPYDLRQEFAPVPLYDDGSTVPVTLDVDSDGRITHAVADVSSVLAKKGDTRVTPSALGEVTGVRVELSLDGFGTSKPAASASPPGRTLDAGASVISSFDAEAGECLDFNTGLRHSRMVVRVPCAGRHDGRVFAQASLDGDYPGAGKALKQAEKACGRSATTDRFWFTWSSAREWSEPGGGRATCYVVTGEGRAD